MSNAAHGEILCYLCHLHVVAVSEHWAVLLGAVCSGCLPEDKAAM